MRKTLLALAALALLASCPDPTDPAGWARAAVKRNRVHEKVEAIQMARKAPGDRAAAVPDLVSLLREAPRVRAEAAAALGEIGDRRAVRPLVEAVDLSGASERASEVNEANRQIAAALGALRAREAVPALVRLARSRDGFTQVAAVEALGEVGDPAGVEVLSTLATGDDVAPFTSKQALLALGRIADGRAAPAVLKMLFRERSGVSFFPEASFAAYQIGRPVSDPLLRVLRGEDTQLEAWARKAGVVAGALYAKAAQVLADAGEARAVPALVQKLGYRDARPQVQLVVRVYAAEALGRLRAREAVRPLSATMLREKDAALRDRCAEALGRIGDRSALPALSRAALTGAWQARAVPLWAAVRLGGPAEAKLVDAAARAGAPAGEVEHMRAALAAAGQCRDDLGCWRRKLTDRHPSVRDRAALEVGWRGGPGDAEALAAAASLPVVGDPELSARYHALLALEWATREGAPAAAAVAAKLEELVERDRGRSFTAKVNEDAKRLAVRLARRAHKS